MMASAPTALPRVTIQYCTKCKWNLRAFYFAQELLSTFGSAIGEVAVQPSTEGTFVVAIYHASTSTGGSDGGEVQIERNVLWDRRAEGGFPETKELKKRVRDIIEPGRDLGHVDGKKKSVASDIASGTSAASSKQASAEEQYIAENADHGQGEEVMPPRSTAVDQLAGGGNASLRKFLPMDVDSAVAAEMKEQQYTDESGVTRNADGTVCGDCN